MLNISQLLREDKDYPLWKKIKNFTNPDQYLAENMADFMINAPRLEVPWWKDFPITDKLERQYFCRAYITIKNVGIKLIDYDEENKSRLFKVHDSTGQDHMVWYDKDGFFQPINSFEECQEEQGLREEDWVYDIFFRYLIKKDLAFLLEVRKYPPIIITEEKDSLLEKIKNFLPSYEPARLPIRN